MTNYAQKKIEFESRAFEVNKNLLLYLMGADSVVNTDYGLDEYKVIDYLGIDKVFCKQSRRKTTSLRIRKEDWNNITIRGHISDPYSQTSKLYNVIANGDSYADYTLQINGVDPSTLNANSTVVRLSNRLLSTMIVRMHRDGILEHYWVDKGDNTRFYDFSYTTLHKYSVVPMVARITEGGSPVMVEL